MAETTAPAPPSPMWDAIKSLTPSIGTCLTLLIGGLVTWGGMAVKAHYDVPRSPLQAADAPKPIPLTSLQDLENMLGSYGARIDKRFDAVDKRLEELAPRVAPSKVRPLK